MDDGAVPGRTARVGAARLPTPPVIVITDRRRSPCSAIDDVAAVLDAGCRWLVVREKDLAFDALASLTAGAVAAARAYAAVVLVAGAPDVAVAVALRCGAAGVHLPRDGDVTAARSSLGADAVIGLSAHDAGEARHAATTGADYVTMSPVFASDSKPGYGPALGIAGLARAVGVIGVDVPVIALGGITTPSDVGACRAAGAAGVAVMGAVARAEDPGAVVAALIAGWVTSS